MHSTSVLLNAGYLWKYFLSHLGIFSSAFTNAQEWKAVLWFVCVVFCDFNNRQWNSYYTCISISESIVGLLLSKWVLMLSVINPQASNRPNLGLSMQKKVFSSYVLPLLVLYG